MHGLLKKSLQMIDYRLKLDEIPELDVYKSNLELLNNFQFDNFIQEKIKDTVLAYTVLIPQIPCLSLNPTDFNLSNFYRARKNINTKREDLTQVKTFSYPDKKYCSGNGRANLRGQSVFYCSEEFATSIIETGPENEDIYYISIWQPNTTRNVNAATFIRRVKKVEHSELKEIELIKPLNPQISQKGIDKTQQVECLINFIENKYKLEEKPYYFTSCFSDYLINQRNFDCIIYQSAEVNSFCNFAFNTDFIDNLLLKFRCVIKLEIIQLNQFCLTYSLQEIGELKCGSVIWRPLSSSEKMDYDLIIQKESHLLKSLI
jgi:RES domain